MQKVISDFLSLDDDDHKTEANKDLIIELLGKKFEELKDTAIESTTPKHMTTGFRMDSSGRTSARESPSSPEEPKSKVRFEPVGSPTDERQEGIAITAANLSQHNQEGGAKGTPPRPAPSRPMNRAASQDSTISRFYTGAELEEYAKETSLPPCLAVSVMRGEMIPKREGEARLHHSYETILRVLPFDETTFPNKENIDQDAYQQVAAIPPVSVTSVFDGYRQLKESLEECAVFSKDNNGKARQYNESDTARRHAIVINANFAKTLRRSSLGIGLTESQLQLRVVDINHWMGELLKAFPNLPKDAQRKILEFLNLSMPSAPIDDKGPKDGVDPSEIFASM